LHEATYRKLLEDHAPVEQVSAGPAYWLPTPLAAPAEQSLALDASTAHLLRGGLEDWIPDVPHQRPFHVALADDHAVAVCASVRITPAAHEAGVETLPAYRRRGHALTAVAGWANAVAALGALPLYSTSWENEASQGVAARLGARLIGADFYVT
jgi:RimJ/RimL family protein N-acetyltransferase